MINNDNDDDDDYADDGNFLGRFFIFIFPCDNTLHYTFERVTASIYNLQVQINA